MTKNNQVAENDVVSTIAQENENEILLHNSTNEEELEKAEAGEYDASLDIPLL